MIGAMTRALVAVGALLALAFLIFGVVVYAPRDEDRITADNLLSENLTRAIQLAEEESDGEVDLRTVADFPWDRVLILFVVIARVITRDARQTLREAGRSEAPQLRDEGPHKHKRQAKAKARAKGKAQRQARRQNR